MNKVHSLDRSNPVINYAPSTKETKRRVQELSLGEGRKGFIKR